MNRVTRFRFTVRAIEQLQACAPDAPGKGYEVSDTEIPGLRLSVSKGSGRKTFWLRYSFKGTKRAMRLGGFPATSLARKGATWSAVRQPLQTSRRLIWRTTRRCISAAGATTRASWTST